MTRRELREHCFKMLFCADFYPAEETAGQLERYFEATEEDETTPEGEIQILHQVDMEEMGKVELTILRLALYEILHDEEIPEKVAINEAVELAKKFGGDDSPSFINGVLARLVRGREEARKDNGADTVS